MAGVAMVRPFIRPTLNPTSIFEVKDARSREFMERAKPLARKGRSFCDMQLPQKCVGPSAISGPSNENSCAKGDQKRACKLSIFVPFPQDRDMASHPQQHVFCGRNH